MTAYKKIADGIKNSKYIEQGIKDSLLKLVKENLGIFSDPFEHQVKALEYMLMRQREANIWDKTKEWLDKSRDNRLLVVLDAPVCLEDIYPTLLDACGFSIPDNIDGSSLLLLIRGKIPQVHPFIHIQHRSFYPELEGFHALTDGKRKFIWFFDQQINTFQYFDLEKDPDECTDCINNPVYTDEIAVWKETMIKQLQQEADVSM